LCCYRNTGLSSLCEVEQQLFCGILPDKVDQLLDIGTLGVLTHGHWIWMVVFLGVWRVLIDYCIAPRVFGRELEIHPLLAIFTLMVGAAVGGFAGVYLAVPIAAVIRVIWRRLGSSRDGSDLPSAVIAARGQTAVS
jgi:hypothetical protein